MIRAIIFDCFGVLVEDALSVLRDELRQREPAKAQRMVDILHASHRGFITPEESNREIAALLGMSVSEYRKKIVEGEAKNKPLMQYIHTLKSGYKTAILSNISMGGLQRRFTADEISESFDVVVASGDTGYAKPEAQIYEIAADRLGVRIEECIFTDDNADFCGAARGLGMQAIQYETFEQFKTDLEKVLAKTE